jgi:hypothetical protein
VLYRRIAIDTSSQGFLKRGTGTGIFEFEAVVHDESTGLSGDPEGVQPPN